jgi:hypothetical protein
VADGLVDATRAAELLGVPRGRIYAWKNSGDVTPAGLVPGTSRSGMVPMFKLDELRPLAERYHAGVARRRASAL